VYHKLLALSTHEDFDQLFSEIPAPLQ
jgi:hypothetical protein